MSKVKYDGWTLKNCAARKPHLLLFCCATKRKDVVKKISEIVPDSYDGWKKRVGNAYKIVKVRIVEVEE